MKPICFLSDFGLVDDFVGTCKGVMARIAPGANIIDLTHDVPGFDPATGAEILKHAVRYMPKDTVYLAVVDPGVGTGRRGLALQAGDAYLVGPDNGLLAPAASSLGGVSEAVSLTNPHYHVHPVSSTFHGRDIFAPVAAHLAFGAVLSDLGDPIDPAGLESSNLPGVEVEDGGFSAQVISIDRYGNARLSMMEEELGLNYDAPLRVDTGDGDMPVRYIETFGSAKAGELILVPDSHWRMSLAINMGSARHALGLEIGACVRLTSVEKEEDHGT
ncbi:MAG: SAM-dependent chlorinase/fluorinase [Rubrobacteraceae bacterium]